MNKTKFVRAAFIAPLLPAVLVTLLIVIFGQGSYRVMLPLSVSLSLVTSYLGFFLIGLPLVNLLGRRGHLNFFTILIAGGMGGVIVSAGFSLFFGTFLHFSGGYDLNGAAWGAGLGLSVAIPFYLIAGLRASDDTLETSSMATALGSVDTPEHLNYWAALIGGLTAVGTHAILGTFVANITLWLFMSKGLSVQQAYARMGESIVSPAVFFSLAVACVAGVFGGYISARYGSRRYLLQGFAAGVISTSLFIVGYLNPSSQSLDWQFALSISCALLSGLLGGLIYARRA